MSMMLCVTLFSCSDSEELYEPVEEQEVKDDSGKDDNKAWEDPRNSVEYLNMRNYRACHPGVAR